MLFRSTSGVATAGGSLKLYKAESATIAVTDGTISAAVSDRLTVTVSGLAASRLVVSGSGSQTAGQAQTVTIAAKDTYGNTDTTYTGDKTLTFSGAGDSTNPVVRPTVTDKNSTKHTFGAATTVNFTAGSASASMTLYNAETSTVAEIGRAHV